MYTNMNMNMMLYNCPHFYILHSGSEVLCCTLRMYRCKVVSFAYLGSVAGCVRCKVFMHHFMSAVMELPESEYSSFCHLIVQLVVNNTTITNQASLFHPM